MKINVLKRCRGWPVQANDCPKGVNHRSYAAWRLNSGLPEDSPDFSVRDVFDMLEFYLEKQRLKDLSD